MGIPIVEIMAGSDAKKRWTGVEVKCSGVRYLSALGFYSDEQSESALTEPPTFMLVGVRVTSPWAAVRELELDVPVPADASSFRFGAQLLYRGLLDTGRATLSVDLPLARVLLERGTLDDTVNRLELRAPNGSAFKLAAIELQLTRMHVWCTVLLILL